MKFLESIGSDDLREEVADLKKKLDKALKAIELMKAVISDHNVLIMVAAEQQEQIIEAIRKDTSGPSISFPIIHPAKDEKPN